MPRHEQTVDDEEVVETVVELVDQGETLDGNGGATTDRLADELPFAVSTIKNHCSRLVDDGKLERVWGFKDRRPVVSYLPAKDNAGDESR